MEIGDRVLIIKGPSKGKFAEVTKKVTANKSIIVITDSGIKALLKESEVKLQQTRTQMENS